MLSSRLLRTCSFSGKLEIYTRRPIVAMIVTTKKRDQICDDALQLCYTVRDVAQRSVSGMESTFLAEVAPQSTHIRQTTTASANKTIIRVIQSQ